MQVTLTGRAYAVHEGSRFVLICLSSIGIACIVLDVVSCAIPRVYLITLLLYLYLSKMHIPGVECFGGTSNELYVLTYTLLEPQILSLSFSGWYLNL